MDEFRLAGVVDSRMTPEYAHKALLMAKLALWEIRPDESGELVILVGKDFKDLLQWSEDEFPHRLDDFLDQCVHPEGRDTIARIARRYMNGDASGPTDRDMRLRHRQSGEWRWYRVLCTAGDKIADGKPDAIFGSVIDVHEAHMAHDRQHAGEVALRTERKRMDAIIEASGIMVWDWNLVDNTSVVGGGPFDGSQGLFSPAKPVTEIWDRVMRRSEAQKIIDAKDRYIAGETPDYEVEIELLGEDGQVRWGHDHGKVVEWDEEGRPIRMMGVTLNIDSLKNTAKALADSELYLEQVVESTNIAIWDWDVATDALTVNRNYARMLGYDFEEMMPTMSQVMELIHPDDVQSIHDLNAEVCRSGGESRQYNLRLRHKSGKYIWVFGQERCLQYDSSDQPVRIVGTQMDFTRWKDLEEKQAESLHIISSQKEILEHQLSERLKLINEVQRQVAEMIETPSNRLDSVQKKIRRDLFAVRDEIEKNGVDVGDAFSRYMKLAFRFISNEMIWYKAVLDNLPFPTSVFDLTRRWYYLNQPAVEVMGGEKTDDFLGAHYSQGWKNYKDSDLSLLDDGVGKKTFTRRLVDSDRIFQCQSSFLLGENNRPLGLIETMQDITAAYDAEERIKLMLDATPIACSFFGTDGSLLDCNMEAAAICGLSDKAEYIERFYEYMPPTLPDGRDAPQVMRDAVSEAFEKGSAELDLFYLRNGDGADIPGEVRMIRVEWRENFIVLGYFTDVRKLLAARRQLDQERLMLREILESCPVCFSVSRDNVVRFVTANTRNLLNLNVGDHYSKIIAPEMLVELREEINAGGGKGLPWRPVILTHPGGTRVRYMLTVLDVEYEGDTASIAWYLDMETMEKRLAEAGRRPWGDTAAITRTDA